jgi:U3 small nucleolar RNA-associated protein 14
LNEDSDDVVSDAVSMDDPEEDEDEEMEDGDAENFFDILEVFDGKADADDDTPAKKTMEKIKDPMSNVSGEDSESEVDRMSEDDHGEEEDAVSASEDEASPEALAELESFLSKLDAAEDKKRKSNDVSATESIPKKRRLMQERTEAGDEGEFGVSAGESQPMFLCSFVLRAHAGSRALKLDDLLAPLASSSTLTTLKKSMKALTSTSNKTKTLSAPLPQRAQERLDREAAYEQTKEEVDKWSATMKHIKQAIIYPVHRIYFVTNSRL